MPSSFENPDSDVSVENLNTETLNSNQIADLDNIILEEQQQPLNMSSRKNPQANPDPEEAEVVVVALSPNSLMMKNRYVCEVCNKGFQRDQNLQLHRRGHNLPWKLKTTKSETRKKVYLCPEASCPHHFRSRALGDMTGIKKHYLRKHCEKKYKCAKCSKCYAVLSDLKAHIKTCGTNSYKCDCGLLFARRDTFRTHKAFCEVLTAETERVTASHPRLETSSEDDSANETMVNFYQGNISPPPGFEPMHHQLNMPPPPDFHHHQLMASGSTSPPRYVLKNEAMNVDFHQASPFTMSQAAAMQSNHEPETTSAHTLSAMSLFQTVNMIGGDSVEDMTGSTIMSHLQLGGNYSAHNVAPPVDYYYYDLLMGTREENENEPPTRDFLGLSSGNGGGANSTTMDDFIVALGGGANVNSGGGGVNVYGEGGEWVPGMAKLENDGHVKNAPQMYGFYGGPSSSNGMNFEDRK